MAPRAIRTAATLEQVARLAGVSRATVSRVVNRSPKVSDEIRRSVDLAISELGYIPNRAARSLVTRRSDSIAVVITEPTGRLFSDPFFPRLRGISAELTARDLQLVLLMPGSPREEERVRSYLGAGHVDGALLVSLHGDDPLPNWLAERDIPVVVGGRPPRGAQVSYVDVDNRQGARSAVEHLTALGRRHIATIAGPTDMGAGIDRLAGYRDALGESGGPADPELVAFADFSQDGGAAAMRSLLSRRPDVDAVFAASDLMAAGAMLVLDAARRPPRPRGRRRRRLRRLADRRDDGSTPHQRPSADRGDGRRDDQIAHRQYGPVERDRAPRDPRDESRPASVERREAT